LAKGGHGERAEREPITVVWGLSPQRGPGAETLVRESGGKAPPPETETLFAFERSVEAANSLIFSEIWKRRKSQIFALFFVCHSPTLNPAVCRTKPGRREIL